MTNGEQNPQTEAALETYKRVRSRFYEAANKMFGPGFMSMVEYYYMKKTGDNLFTMLFREPSKIYGYLADMMKGEDSANRLLGEIGGANHERLIRHMKGNDGHLVWGMLEKATTSEPLTSSVEKARAAAAQ